MQKWWRNRQTHIRINIKKTRLFRIWGHKLFENVLWRIDKKGIAGGLSLGLFVAFMPTVGFQMILAAFGAIYFKVNLPIALLMCWITNPVTAILIYTAEWRLGRYILEDFTPLKEAFDLYNIEGRSLKVILNGIYIWTGAIVFSTISALAANILIRLIWNLGSKITKKSQST
ncbi:MAG: DUF2062 domain-containing protein [Phycisphaerae bacterium]|nr:DUF2062 domain-containing protein [Phycisphaerae bacterium]